MDPQKKKKKYVQKKVKYVEKKVQSKEPMKVYNESLPQVPIKQNPKKQQSKTSVINVKAKYLRQLGYNNLEQWIEDENHLYIGRDMTHYVPGAVGSKWANPFKVEKFGREECLMKYKNYILESKQLMKEIKTLKGKVLGCWCAPEGCHGDILALLADES